MSLHAHAGRPLSYVMSKSEAEGLADELRTSIPAGTREAAVPDRVALTFGDVADRYLERYVPFDRGRPRRAAGRKLMEWYVKRLKQAEIPAAGGARIRLELKPLTEITKADVVAIREGWKRKATCSSGGNIGADRALKRLRHLFNWAIQELLALQWRHVSDRIDLPGEITKTGEPRTVPIVPNGRLAGVLAMRRHDPAGELHPPTAHVFGSATGEPIADIRTEWTRTCEAAKVTGLKYHDLRREFGSQLLETPNVQVHHVRDALGHADLKTTSRYLATTLKRLDDVLRRKEQHRASGFAHDSHTDLSADSSSESGTNAEPASNSLSRLN